MTDDFVNDPYDEAPVHVLDEDGEPDAVAEQGAEGAEEGPSGSGAAESSPGDDAGESGVREPAQGEAGPASA